MAEIGVIRTEESVQRERTCIIGSEIAAAPMPIAGGGGRKGAHKIRSSATGRARPTRTERVLSIRRLAEPAATRRFCLRFFSLDRTRRAVKR